MTLKLTGPEWVQLDGTVRDISGFVTKLVRDALEKRAAHMVEARIEQVQP